MAADLHIHVFAEGELSDDDFAAFFSTAIGSRWCGRPGKVGHLVALARVGEKPSVWIGEVSWLKADLFHDSATYIPPTVQQVSDIIGEELPVVDDALIARIVAAFDAPNPTMYALARRHDVEAFLQAHRGKRAFTVSW